MHLLIPRDTVVRFLKSCPGHAHVDKEDEDGHHSRYDSTRYSSEAFTLAELAELRQCAIATAESERIIKPRSKGDDRWYKDYTKKEQKEIRSAAKMLAQDIQAILALEQDGDRPKSLKTLPTAVMQFCRRLPFCWMMQADPGCADRKLVLITGARYLPPEDRKDYYIPAQVTVAYSWWCRGHEREGSVTIAKTRMPDLTVQQVLGHAGLQVPSKEQLVAHDAEAMLYLELRDKTGLQFLTEAVVRSERRSWRDDVPKTLAIEGQPTRAVMDDEGGDYGSDPRSTTMSPGLNDGWAAKNDDDVVEGDTPIKDTYLLPVDPQVRVFDLKRHDHYIVRVNELERYVYDPGLINKLVLPVTHKKLVEALLRAATDPKSKVGDFIRGKSGGTTVLCHGKPGTGKTLTAECFSELVERPLYSVQCSQLGLDVEAVEKNLQAVLANAERWGACLLIDEADVYIRKRGESMAQNAVIGTFLRVLEYFDGIMFLTTNRGGDVDDAIRSRCIAEISYDVPEDDKDKAELWRVLSKTYGFKLSAALVAQLAKEFPNATGRDVKQLCRLVRVNEGDAPTLASFKKMAPFKPID